METALKLLYDQVCELNDKTNQLIYFEKTFLRVHSKDATAQASKALALKIANTLNNTNVTMNKLAQLMAVEVADEDKPTVYKTSEPNTNAH